MKTKGEKYGYIEWLSAEEMHEASMQWMSELKFVRDEQLFLNDLIKLNTLNLIDDTIFDESKSIIDAISLSEKEVVQLLKKVQSHENLLEIMVNDVDELEMESAYLETHWRLVSEIQKYISDYRKIKTKLFDLISSLLKKNKRLLT